MSGKKVKALPDVRVSTLEELENMSLEILKVPVLNWQETDLGIQDESESEEEGEYELTGKWRFIPSWIDPEDEWSFTEPWEPLEIKYGRPVYESEYEGEWEGEAVRIEVVVPRAPVILTRTNSCEGRLESFHVKQLGGKKVYGEYGEERIPPIKVKRDLEPLPGTEHPRFVYETESEANLGKKREIKIVEFHDNSVLDTIFRIWRRTAAGGAGGLEIAEEDDEDIEDLLSLEVLEIIRPIFKGALTLEQYTVAITKALRLQSKKHFPKCLTELFTKIDTFGIGRITWDDLCDFLQQKYAEKNETEYSTPPIDIIAPCRVIETVHRAPVIKAITLPDRGLLTFSDDGIVSLWTTDYEPRIWRALGRPASLKSQSIADKKANKWYTDIVLLQGIGKYVVPTGEKELQFYDTSTYDPYCQIQQLHSVPIHIDAKLNGNGVVIAMGDIEGNVCVLIINDAINTLRRWSQQRRLSNIPTISLADAVGVDLGVRYVKYKVHNDMISHIYFVATMNRVITSSMDIHKSLAMGQLYSTKNANELMEDLTTSFVEGVTDIATPPMPRKVVDETKFPIHNGCRSFDLWEEKRWLAAGGLDRIVWVWNTYVPHQPVAKLRGHNAAIFRVVFDTKSETLFSICTDKVIRVWTLYTNTCIHTFDTKQTKLRGPSTYCFFPTTDSIFVQTSVEAAYIPLKRKGEEESTVGITHGDAITGIMYNPQHNYVMTCSSEDILVWDCETGKLVAEFNTIGGDGSMHLDTIQSKLEKTMEEEIRFVMPLTLLRGREQVDTYDVGTVTAVALDNFGRRFFTAHANGVIKAWNFYNGRNLYNLYKPLNNMDICDMHYITINDEHRYLVTVGWDRRVVVYIDTQGPEVLQNTGLPDEPLIFSDKKINHRDDVWAVTFGFPNLIASGDHSGKLLVWNINSGHVVANLKANPCRDKIAEKHSFITQLVFHEHKFRNTSKITYLLSAGPYHLIHIYRANTTRELNVGSVGWTRPCGSYKDYVTSMKCFKGNNNVITADSYGCVSVWVIEDALGNTEPTEWFPKVKEKDAGGRNRLKNADQESSIKLKPKQQGYGKGPVQLRLIRTWKCHVDAFPGLEICETFGLIFTGGRDCSVRVWDMEGQHLGILGQETRWLVGDKMSYAFCPPRDVLLDMKRVRALEVFRKEPPEKLKIELNAENRARKLIERKKNKLLNDNQIYIKALPYQQLMHLTVKPINWLLPDAPVGPHRRPVINRSRTLIEVNLGGALGYKKDKELRERERQRRERALAEEEEEEEEGSLSSFESFELEEEEV